MAFTQLKELLKSHNKVKHIQYDNLEIQPYLKSNLFTSKEACMLTALRSQCVRGIKCNFKKMYNNCVQCPLKCESKNIPEDSQEHTLNCKSLNVNTNMNSAEISHMYGTIQQQNILAKQFCTLMRKQEIIIEEQAEAPSSSLPGATSLDHSSQQHQELKAAAILVHDIVQLQG